MLPQSEKELSSIMSDDRDIDIVRIWTDLEQIHRRMETLKSRMQAVQDIVSGEVRQCRDAIRRAQDRAQSTAKILRRATALHERMTDEFFSLESRIPPTEEELKKVH